MPRRLRFIILVLVVGLLSVIGSQESNAQADPRQVLNGVIVQLQTGTPNPMWYGPQLWQAIAMQTGNSGIYPQLVQLGQVQSIDIRQQQQLPQGMLYFLAVMHSNGQSTWELGISAITNRIEYANFHVGASPSPFPQPSPSPKPSPPLPPPGPGSGACQKFPNLC
jgi:hypothetical protein